MISCGKAFIAGEYAVLFGKSAIVAAVDRYATCSIGATNEESALQSITKSICAEHGYPALSKHYIIDTKDFYSPTSGQKLGLGSSAAAITAFCKMILNEHQVQDHRLLFKLSLLAHKKFSLDLGSGADVAASVFGGLIRFQKGLMPHQLSMPDLWPDLLFIDTMRSQNTRDFVAAVMKLDKDPYTKDFCERSETLVTDFLKAPNRISVFDELFSLLKKLGVKAEIPIISPEHQIIKEIANHMGGSAKPSGAGGGDLAVVLVPKESHELFLREMKTHGFEAINLKLCPKITWP